MFELGEPPNRCFSGRKARAPQSHPPTTRAQLLLGTLVKELNRLGGFWQRGTRLCQSGKRSESRSVLSQSAGDAPGKRDQKEASLRAFLKQRFPFSASRVCANLRFGRALARLRTKHQDHVRKRALKFLSGDSQKKKQLSAHAAAKQLAYWVAHADLQPVLDYLTS